LANGLPISNPLESKIVCRFGKTADVTLRRPRCFYSK
jgi:hypothetical protein